MVSMCYRGGQWRWLSAYERDGGGRVLVEQRGACPGDPHSTFVTFAGVADGDRLAETARAWLRDGWAAASEEGPAAVGRDRPSRTASPVSADPGDRTLDETTRQAVVKAVVSMFAQGFCVFANPAVTGQ